MVLKKRFSDDLSTVISSRGIKLRKSNKPRRTQSHTDSTRFFFHYSKSRFQQVKHNRGTYSKRDGTQKRERERGWIVHLFQASPVAGHLPGPESRGQLKQLCLLGPRRERKRVGGERGCIPPQGTARVLVSSFRLAAGRKGIILIADSLGRPTLSFSLVRKWLCLSHSLSFLPFYPFAPNHHHHPPSFTRILRTCTFPACPLRM